MEASRTCHGGVLFSDSLLLGAVLSSLVGIRLQTLFYIFGVLDHSYLCESIIKVTAWLEYQLQRNQAGPRPEASPLVSCSQHARRYCTWCWSSKDITNLTQAWSLPTMIPNCPRRWVHWCKSSTTITEVANQTMMVFEVHSARGNSWLLRKPSQKPVIEEVTGPSGKSRIVAHLNQQNKTAFEIPRFIPTNKNDAQL